MIEAVEAVEAAESRNRADFYWTLHGVLVKRHEHSALFDQAFRIFWRRRDLLEKMMEQFMRSVPADPEDKREQASKRVADALFPNPPSDRPPEPPKPQLELDMRMSLSDQEMFRARDFEQMSALEIEQAKRDIAKLVLPFDTVMTRRRRPDPHGAVIDPRRSMRASMRAGGAAIELRFSSRVGASSAHRRAVRHFRLDEPV